MEAVAQVLVQARQASVEAGLASTHRGRGAALADLDGDGVDTVGIYRPSSGLVSFVSGLPSSFLFGTTGDRAIFGAWEGSTTDTVGVFRERSGMFFLRSSNTTGAADHSFNYGASGLVPISGFFGDLPGGSDPPTPSLCPVS